MDREFRNISKVGYMLHNGGLEFKKISETEYEYRATLKDIHMNAAGSTHGGFLMSILDSGMGTAVHQVIDGIAVTITLDIKFIAGSKSGDEIIGYAKIKKQTRERGYQLQTKGVYIVGSCSLPQILSKEM